MSADLINESAVALAAQIHSGAVSSRDVVSAHLDAIDTHNDAINAIISMRDREAILADAQAADDATARGDDRGVLHGLPVAVKDLEAVAGLPTRLGSLTTNDTPATSDGMVAQRFREAGAIIIAKTNTPEFGTGSQTFNEIFGMTRNPWNLDRTPGGSSGGAAAALASRMLPIADGSDFGGSLRNPAGFTNVVGHRPSIGVVPQLPVRSTHLLRLGLSGPMGRTVADASLVLEALAGQHPLDPLSLAIPPGTFSAPLPDSTTATVGWVGDLGLFTVDPEVFELSRSGAAAVEQAGGSFREISADLSNAMQVFRVLRGLSYRSHGLHMSASDRDLVKATVLENIEYGEGLTVNDVLEAEVLRGALHVEMMRVFDEVDVIALPTTQVAPFSVDMEFPMVIDGVDMKDYLDWMTTCCVITPTGCPAVSIPAGFTTEGLPIGVQLVGRVGLDRELLEVAAAIEAANPLHLQTPTITHRG